MSKTTFFPYPRLALSLAIGCLAALPLAAQGPENLPRAPSPEQGLALADKLCTSCHLIGTEPGATTQVGPPSFPTMANRPEQTAERIKGILMQPHAPMPDIQLTNDEMTDLIAYLDTLRTVQPPLLPAGSRDKPKRPSAT